MQIVPKERKFNDKLLMPKLTEKCLKNCQKVEKVGFFASYTAACWPARFG